jgi:hypothetical protein
VVWTETQHRVRFKPIEISKGLTGIQVNSMAELPETINAVIQAVKAGELDAQLKAAADASPIKKAREKMKK